MTRSTITAIYYSPQNAIIVAVGDFDADKVLKQISEAFGSIKNGPKPPPVTRSRTAAGGRAARRAAPCGESAGVHRGLSRAELSRRRRDAFALEIASEILSDGKSSRLYQDLVVDKRMVVEVSAPATT